MNELITTLIVDDELQSRLLIRKLLTDFFPEAICHEAGDVETAFVKIRKNNPDLIFLDVQMNGETGFDLLDKLSSIPFGIIFTTAYSEFAVKAFRYSAIDYLVKPIDSEEFKIAFTKALQQKHLNPSHTSRFDFLQQHIKTPNTIPDKITVPTVEGFLFISVNDIFYCHAVNNYTEFHLDGNRKILSSYTLGYYTELLQSHNFFKVHRSYLINLHHIKMYKRGEGGIVVMNNGEQIEISRSNKEAFLKLFKG